MGQDSYGRIVEKKISLEMERLKGSSSNPRGRADNKP